MNNEECLICGAPLEYLQESVLMECCLCHKKQQSLTRCVHGHYVCDECHSEGLDTLLSVCLHETSKDPIAIVRKLMAQPFCHMHGPEHHTMVGAALLTAYKNAGGDIDLARILPAMLEVRVFDDHHAGMIKPHHVLLFVYCQYGV